MSFIFFGPPGSGKGTQSELLKVRNNLNHISTGDLLRAAMKGKTPLGLKAQEFVDRGALVPDSMVIELLESTLRSTLGEFIIDGFPRNISQADSFAEMTKRLNISIKHSVFFNIGIEGVVKRISGRRVCESCGSVYNIFLSPPKNGSQCEKCGGNLIQRADDKEEVVRTRMGVYLAQTAPLIEYYKKNGLFVEIDAEKDTESIYKSLLKLI